MNIQDNIVNILNNGARAMVKDRSLELETKTNITLNYIFAKKINNGYRKYKNIIISPGENIFHEIRNYIEEMSEIYSNFGDMDVEFQKFDPDSEEMSFWIRVKEVKSEFNIINSDTIKYKLILFRVKTNSGGDPISTSNAVLQEGTLKNCGSIEGNYEKITEIFNEYVEENIPNFIHYGPPSIDIDNDDEFSTLELAFYQAC